MTIRSMTAFARETLSTPEGDLTIELRTVNHRYLDCTFKLPDALRQLEPKLRDLAGRSLTRGKLDCMVRLQLNSEAASSLDVDRNRLDKLLHSAAAIAQQLPDSQPLNTLDILQFPGICAASEASFDTFLSAATSLTKNALASLTQSREREGEKLAEMILSRLDLIELELKTTRSLMPQLMEAQRERVISRIAEMNIEVDTNRLEQELVHLAQKADVEEELDRLDAHLEEVRRVLKKGGPCGKSGIF